MVLQIFLFNIYVNFFSFYFQFLLIKIAIRKGTMVCLLHLSPKLYNNDFLMIDFIEFLLVGLSSLASKRFNHFLYSIEGVILWPLSYPFDLEKSDPPHKYTRPSHSCPHLGSAGSRPRPLPPAGISNPSVPEKIKFEFFIYLDLELFIWTA